MKKVKPNLILNLYYIPSSMDCAPLACTFAWFVPIRYFLETSQCYTYPNLSLSVS